MQASLKRGALVAAALVIPMALARAGDAITIHPDQEAKRPALASDASGALHVAYLAYEKDSKVPDIFYTASTDGGKSWAPGVNISKTPGVSSDPDIACGPGGAVTAVWLDTTSGEESPDVFCAYSTDGGKGWSKIVNVSDTPGKSSAPAIAAAPDGTLHVVWIDTTDHPKSPEVWHASSSDHGATWSKSKDISHTPGVSAEPAVACGPKGEVYVCWADTTSGMQSPDIFYCASTDGGKTFSKAIDVSNTPLLSAQPDIAADESGVYIAWMDNGTGAKDDNGVARRDILFAASRDGGKTWEKAIDIAPTTGASSEPALCAAEGHIAAVWRDTTGHEANPEIFLALSADHGKTFGAPKDFSNTPGVSTLPDVTIAKGSVHSIWEEAEGGKTHMKLASQPLK
jgi:hypothetical protein